jgi:hypothetical protein
MKLAEYLKVEGRRVKVSERGPGNRSTFWPALLARAPWLEVQFERVPELATKRTELFGSLPHGEIDFVGEVEGEQLLALVETLRALATGEPQWSSADTRARVEGLERSVDLDVFVSPMCPFCATVSSAALRFATASKAISVRVLRADILGLPAEVHTVPTVLADDEIVAQGITGEESLIRQIGVYQRAVPPVSGVQWTGERPLPRGVRNTLPASLAPAEKPRRPRSTAA